MHTRDDQHETLLSRKRALVKAAQRGRNVACPPRGIGATRPGPAPYRVRMRNTGTRGQGGLADYLMGQLKARGWSKAEMGRQLGVDRTTIFRWLTGNIRNVQPHHVQHMAAVFGDNEDELLRLAGIRAADASHTVVEDPPIELLDTSEWEIWGMRTIKPSRKLELIFEYRKRQEMDRLIG